MDSHDPQHLSYVEMLLHREIQQLYKLLKVCPSNSMKYIPNFYKILERNGQKIYDRILWIVGSFVAKLRKDIIHDWNELPSGIQYKYFKVYGEADTERQEFINTFKVCKRKQLQREWNKSFKQHKMKLNQYQDELLFHNEWKSFLDMKIV